MSQDKAVAASLAVGVTVGVLTLGTVLMWAFVSLSFVIIPVDPEGYESGNSMARMFIVMGFMILAGLAAWAGYESYKKYLDR